MDILEFRKTVNAPYVRMDPRKGEIHFEGRSIPEDPGEYYEEILEWTERYFKDPCPKTTVNFKLEYVNSGSSKYILEFLRLIRKYVDSGHQCEINWYYEEDDESIKELGEHYHATLGEIPFNIIDYY